VKKLLLATALLVATAPAYAADLPMIRKAPISAPIVSWTGFYLGASLGASWANNDWTTTATAPLQGGVPDSTAHQKFDSVAARIGGYVGYNWQVAPTFLLGWEGDFGWAGNRHSQTVIPGTPNELPGFPLNGNGDTAEIKEGWDGSLRGRAGVLVTPTTLLFGTAGIAFQQVTTAASCFGNDVNTVCAFSHANSFSDTRVGWTAGAGIEQMAWGNWIARVEYRYASFGTMSKTFFTVVDGADDRVFADIKSNVQSVSVGIAYKFGGPVYAKY